MAETMHPSTHYCTGTFGARGRRELYLPQSWAEDRNQCREAGIPISAQFAAKPRPAQAMTGRTQEAGLPFAGFTADGVWPPLTRHRVVDAQLPVRTRCGKQLTVR